MRTTYRADRVLNTYRGTNDTAPATIYVGLLTAVTDAEAGTVTEASYAGYARKAVTFGAPGASGGGRQITNSGTVLFDPKTDVGQVSAIAVGYYDAITAGNLTDVMYQDGADPLMASVDAAEVITNILDSPAHGLVTDQQVRLEAFGGAPTLPGGLSANTTYWVITALTDSFQLALTQGGAAIDLTAAGRALVHKLTPKVIQQNDQPQFAVGQLKLTEF